MEIKYGKDELQTAVKNSLSIAEVCRQLKIRPVGGNYRTLKSKLKKWGIDVSHFTGQGWNIGLKFKPKKRKPLNEILVENSDYNSNKLRIRLLNEGIKESKCESCGLNEWLNKPIKLELHHVNGDNTDNRLKNLQILCPNCHSMTENFRKGKSALFEKRDVEYRKVKETLTSNVDGNLEPSEEKNSLACAETRHGKPKKEYVCGNCNQKFKGKQAKYCSPECYRETVNKHIPKVPEILEMFKKHKTFVGVGKHYNVSDNTIRKWCDKYGILEMVKE
jgi:Zn finger protein HypA/HybF involved in hydrogenase expression